MDLVKQLPLRGIAMILIAVALMLGAWGVYSVTSDNSSSAPKTSTAETSEQTPAEKSAPQAPAVSDTPAASDAPGESAAPAEKTPADKPAADKPAAERPVPVRVLNNSTVQGLAAQVADTLRSHGIDVVEVGNLPDAVVPQTTVFYPAGHQAQAQKIADQLHAVIAQHDNPDIVVVTVQ
ncbi:LytR C-terminal domain-containing protein [Corynebacterium diphtheriae bv. mitis]|uniref:LytR C-terminal domain-containing protein n=1 Tax=Corynebacterium diphtheriae TaxID=1717 RepID=UPI0018CAA33D|nr:LytR C-terminal domain-containing protein [Corynebacterium diphtheriae]MBG9359535.1 LytR C-terminal domain-containing protein [Corynebacterium diphtheriae bv. mitis]MBG9361628.1 LytR C-terminal domain-containing protein [Corynebacterium diphtheriae bv. mitis]MBG9363914.1 LytR C-terminal domain-containing protein [Corynebacterium diphtheriae bv. mitis]MBG9366105.1 LytR C-terminal domain-containing protein [Corynebacterium diphtheriae bv. mitis]UWE83804.1 LytR C-terminal domain-containing pro